MKSLINSNTVLIRYKCHTGMKEAKVHAKWDSEAEVWFATSDEVPGLATEAGTLEDLVGKLQTLVPELIELNMKT
jgi:predicted RNase H-like HicB family nuclease